MNKTYGYARVSTREQNLDRQIDALREYGVAERDIVSDKASGKDLERNGYLFLKERMLREGDTLVIKSLDRLSRNKQEMLMELRYYKEQHIHVKVLDLPTTLIDVPEGQEWIFEMVNNIIMEVLASIAEQEQNAIHQRQEEGIASAKAKGKHLGRPKAVYPVNWERHGLLVMPIIFQKYLLKQEGVAGYATPFFKFSVDFPLFSSLVFPYLWIIGNSV